MPEDGVRNLAPRTRAFFALAPLATSYGSWVVLGVGARSRRAGGNEEKKGGGKRGNLFFVFVGPKPQKFSKLMDEESPRKSLVKGERFVRHDDTSELAQPCSSNTGLRWNIQRRERGNCTLICSWERKRRKKEREEDEGGRNFVFWK